MSYDGPAEIAVVKKAAWRLIPFLFFLYVIAYLDRVNVGFAKLHMNELPWFSDTIYGAGAGIFFLGYFLFEVPSNLILQKVGARIWIARIMFTWGAISMAMALVKGVPSFYGLRFLLGIAEAGFFPGVLLYLTFWFTQKERARVVAMFMTANAIAFIFGGPISGWILGATQGLRGLAGWQWLFLLEGFPAILLGFVVLAYLPNGPRDARWLSEAEKKTLIARLGDSASGDGGHSALGAVLKDSRLWHCAGLFFLMVGGMYGISLWLPQLTKNMSGGSDLMAGLLTAIPYTVSGIVMVLNAIHSDKTGERRLHIAVPALVAACAMAGAGSPLIPAWASLALISVAASGMWAILGPFWSIPSVFLGRSGAAGGIAAINSVGNLAGFAGPFLVGWVKDKTGGSFTWPLALLGLFCFLGSLAAISLPAALRQRPAV